MRKLFAVLLGAAFVLGPAIPAMASQTQPSAAAYCTDTYFHKPNPFSAPANAWVKWTAKPCGNWYLRARVLCSRAGVPPAYANGGWVRPIGVHSQANCPNGYNLQEAWGQWKTTSTGTIHSGLFFGSPVAYLTSFRILDVTQAWCPNFGQSYPSCWVPRNNPGSNMIINDVTSSQQGKAKFHFVANVSNSNWDSSGHAGPFALGTGWNKTYAGTPVYQVMENGGGCAIWHKGTHNTYWSNCTAGAKASLYAIRNSGLTISVGATNAYSGHSGDGNQPSVLTAEGFGNTVQTHSATSNRKTDQHWAR